MEESGNVARMRPPTDLPDDLTVVTPIVRAAVHAADAVARSASAHVRELTTHAELQAVFALYEDIWQPDPKSAPVTTEMLRALAKAGNYVAGAFDGGELLGACVGFFGVPTGAEMHSHIAGVAGAARGRNVGFALKAHQRAWGLLRGVSAITWTFDPLVRRNAHFNIAKLAATPTEYLPNFYGGMGDGINGADDSDRLLMSWRLDDEAVAAACQGVPASLTPELIGDAVVALGTSERGAPVVGAAEVPTILVATPHDIEKTRKIDAGLAREWRIAVREVLDASMADGFQVVGFDKVRGYVLARP